MHDKPASFVKGDGFRLLQDDGRVESVKSITPLGKVNICGLILV